MGKLLNFFSIIFIFSLASTVQARTLLFDDFNGRSAAARSDLWNGEYHAQGRGKYSGPGYKNGNGQLTLGVYSGDFTQQIIRSKKWFRPSENGKIVAEARIRIAHNQPGIVHGFFFYNQYYSNGRLKSDELDFEWLTSAMTGSKDPIQLTTWQKWDRWNPRYGVWNNRNHGTHATSKKGTGKSLNWSWHTYKMVWKRGSVDFYVDNKRVQRWTGAGVPSGSMRLFLNSWVADSGWSEAYDRNFKTGGKNWHSMEVDWVRVTD